MKLGGKRGQILILSITVSQELASSLGPKKPQFLAQLCWKIVNIWQDVTAEENI